MQQQYNNTFQQNMHNMGTSITSTATASNNHSAHELLDTHTVLSGIIGALNEFLMCEQYIKDPELMSILQRQRQFITDQYNITVESYQSGQDPSHPTGSYEMNISNEVHFGLTPSQPTKPNQEASQLGDKCISGVMMSCMKKLASTMTMAASESTNPVVRRILQDSIPNYLEMAYELFLYQNHKGFYQVPQFTDQDMQIMMNSFAPANEVQSGIQNGVQNQNQNGSFLQ